MAGPRPSQRSSSSIKSYEVSNQPGGHSGCAVTVIWSVGRRSGLGGGRLWAGCWTGGARRRCRAGTNVCFVGIEGSARLLDGSGAIGLGSRVAHVVLVAFFEGFVAEELGSGSGFSLARVEHVDKDGKAASRIGGKRERRQINSPSAWSAGNIEARARCRSGRAAEGQRVLQSTSQIRSRSRGAPRFSESHLIYGVELLTGEQLLSLGLFAQRVAQVSTSDPHQLAVVAKCQGGNGREPRRGRPLTYLLCQDPH